MKRRRMYALAALALLAAGVVNAQTVVQDGVRITNRTNADGSVTVNPILPILTGGMVRADSTMQAISMDGSGNLKTVDAGAAGALTGTTFSQANALGPTTFRENVVAKDSTVVMSTLGAQRIGLFFYIIPDTSYAASTDSINGSIHWFALGIRANVTAANDSGSAAIYKPLRPLGSIGGVTAVYGDDTNERVAAVNLLTSLLPGEILIPLHCAQFNGRSGWSYFEINQDAFPGGFMPDRVSFTLRSFGHTRDPIPPAFIRSPSIKTKVRLDVRGYR